MILILKIRKFYCLELNKLVKAIIVVISRDKERNNHGLKIRKVLMIWSYIFEKQKDLSYSYQIGLIYTILP